MSTITKNALNVLSDAGTKWPVLTLVYCFAVAGVLNLISLAVNNTPEPLDDVAIYRKYDKKKHGNEQEYIQQQFLIKEFQKQNVFDDEVDASAYSTLFDKIIDKLSPTSSEMKPIYNLYHTKKVRVKGYRLKLKPLKATPVKLNKQTLELTSKLYFKRNDTKAIYNETRSGVIIKTTDGTYIQCTVPEINCNIPRNTHSLATIQDIHTRYESGWVKLVKPVAATNGKRTWQLLSQGNNEVKKRLKEYLDTTNWPENAQEITVICNVSFGQYNHEVDQLFLEEIPLNQLDVVPSEPLPIDHPFIVRAAEKRWRTNAAIPDLVALMCDFNCGKITLEQIAQAFDIYALEFDMTTKTLIPTLAKGKMILSRCDDIAIEIMLPLQIRVTEENSADPAIMQKVKKEYTPSLIRDLVEQPGNQYMWTDR
jgi:hypothetical protein